MQRRPLGLGSEELKVKVSHGAGHHRARAPPPRPPFPSHASMRQRCCSPLFGVNLASGLTRGIGKSERNNRTEGTCRSYFYFPWCSWGCWGCRGTSSSSPPKKLLGLEVCTLSCLRPLVRRSFFLAILLLAVQPGFASGHHQPAHLSTQPAGKPLPSPSTLLPSCPACLKTRLDGKTASLYCSTTAVIAEVMDELEQRGDNSSDHGVAGADRMQGDSQNPMQGPLR